MREKIKLYKGKVTIWFVDEEYVKGRGFIRHGYFHEKDGGPDFDKRIVSNTGATGMLDKPALVPWAVKMMGLYLQKNWNPKKVNTELLKNQLIKAAKKEFRRITEEGQEIGTETHGWVDQHIKFELGKGKKPKMPENEKVRNGVNGFLGWESENKVKYIGSELMVYSIKYDFVGRLDTKAIVNSKLTILDLKTCNMWKKDEKKPDGFARDRNGNLIKTPVYDSQRYQVAGYRMAEEEENGKIYDGDRIILRLDKEFGEFDPVQLNEYQNDRKGFLSCLDLKKRKRN
ncbi:MAG TPA: hypothetical protein ENI23_09480 [bacterium]|nr:hypothetical protein [bacterium]